VGTGVCIDGAKLVNILIHLIIIPGVIASVGSLACTVPATSINN
jgi:hypothetical protein